MKKTFRSILAGALALMAVSCYDDSKLLDEIGGVKDGLSDLKAQFEEFKTQINGQVSALQTSYTALTASFTEYKGLNDTQVADLNTALDALRGKIEGESGIQSQVTSVLAQLDAYKAANNAKWTTAEAALAALQEKDSQLAASIQSLGTSLGLKDEEILASLTEVAESIVITDVKEENGNVVLTLKNGNKLTVSKDNVVKVVDGKWVAVAADGSEVELGLPITQENLMFNIDWETGMLQYSVDGLDQWDWDKEWIDTYVYVSGNTQGYGIISKAEIYEGSAYLTIDGEDYQFVMMDESTSLEIRAGKTMFKHGETKTIDIKAISLSDVYVMSKPEGWRASVNGAKLSVTAPVAENTYAEQEGLVLLHGTTASGLCKVAKLLVTTSTQGLEIIMDVPNAKAIVRNGLLIESTSMDDELDGGVGAPSYEFNEFYWGLIDVQSWEQAGADVIINEWESFYPCYSMMLWPRGTYGPDYQVDELEFDLKFLYEGLNQMPFEDGIQLVLYAFSADAATGTIDMDSLVYAYYNPVVVKFELDYATHNDINLFTTRIGADSYLIGFGKADEVDDEFVCPMESSFGEWQLSPYRSLGTEVSGTDGAEAVKLSEYDPELEASLLKPSTTYFVYAMPLTAGKDKTEYSYENDFLPYVQFFTTNPLQSGGSSTVAIARNDNATGYYSIYADLTISSDAETVFYKFYNVTDEEWETKFNTDDELVADVLNDGFFNMASAYPMPTVSNLQPGESRILVAFAVDSEGNYGAIAESRLSTKALPIDDVNISVAIKDVVFGENGYPTVTYTVTGATSLIVYSNSYSGKTADLNGANDPTSLPATLLSKVMTSLNYYNKVCPVVNGEVVVAYSSYSDEWSKYSIACGANIEGNVLKSLSTPRYDDLSTYKPAVEPDEPAEPAE